MVPESYKSPEGQVKKPIVLEQRMDEMLQVMVRFQETVAEKFSVWETMQEVERKHVDSILNQLSKGQESLKDDLIYVFKEMLTAYETNTKNEQIRQNERIDAHHDKVNTKLTYMDAKADKTLLQVESTKAEIANLAKRVEDLEEKPLKQAGEQMGKLKEWVLLGVAGGAFTVAGFYGKQILGFFGINI
jgi:polyhydroxyalkanoate synthesis regulator phasin